MAYNTANTDTSFVEMDYSGRSIAFAAKENELFIGGKSNGGVCRNVSQHPMKGVKDEYSKRASSEDA